MLLKVNDLSYYLPNERALFEHVSFSLEPSSAVLIYGGNGSGKSILTRILLGLTDGYQGGIELLGETPRGLDENARQRLFRRIGFLLQEPVVFEDRSVYDNVALYLRINRVPCSRRRVLSLLHENGFSLLKNARMSRLSWGQVRMIELVRLLPKHPQLVICDQPFAGLDKPTAFWMQERFKQLMHAGCAVVATSSQKEIVDFLGWTVVPISGAD